MTVGWRAIGASRTGAHHLRAGCVNQDAIGWRSGEGAGGQVLAAVADGHGASSHGRSDRGSRFAVEAALELLAWHSEETGAPAAALPADILDAWRARVIADMARDPLRGQGVPGAALAAYGTTLLALAADAARLTALQIGDGDLFLLDRAGRLSRPLGTDAELTGEQTYSLCQDDALLRFRVAHVALEGATSPVAAVLTTDGVAKSFGDLDALAAAMRALVAQGIAEPDAAAADLPEWLDRLSRQGSGDDVSLCLVLARRRETGA